MPLVTTFEKTMRDARTQASEFATRLKEYERILEVVSNNGWDQPGEISADMLTPDMLVIEAAKESLPDEERRLRVIARYGAGLRAWILLQQLLDTPIPNLANPEAAIRGFSVDLATLGTDRALVDDPTTLTIRQAIVRMMGPPG